MPKAVVQETIEAPTAADIVNVRLAGNFTDPNSLKVYAQVVLKRDDGSEYLRDTVEVDLAPGARGALINAVVPRLVAAVESKIGITFA